MLSTLHGQFLTKTPHHSLCWVHSRNKQGTEVPSFKLTQVRDRHTILTPNQILYINKSPVEKKSTEKQVRAFSGFRDF